MTERRAFFLSFGLVSKKSSKTGLILAVHSCASSSTRTLSNVIFEMLSARHRRDLSNLRARNDRGTGLDPPYWDDESSAKKRGIFDCLLRGLQNSGGRSPTSTCRET